MGNFNYNYNGVKRVDSKFISDVGVRFLYQINQINLIINCLLLLIVRMLE